MPTYEYKCVDGCGHTFDMFLPMCANKYQVCSKCGYDAERQIGAGGAVIFKGSGFHCNDYPKGNL